MKRVHALIVCAIRVWILVSPDLLLAEEPKDIVTNQTVIDLHQADIGDGPLMELIKKSATHFDIAPKALIALKDSGVSDEVIQLIIRRAASPPDGPSDPRAQHTDGFAKLEPASKPHALLVNDEGVTELPLNTTVVQKLKGGKGNNENLRDVAKNALMSSLRSGKARKVLGEISKDIVDIGALGMGEELVGLVKNNLPKKRRILVLLPGSTASTVLSGSRARFEVFYDGLSHVDPAAYSPIILRAAHTSEPLRLLRSLNARERKGAIMPKGEVLQEVVPTSVDLVAPGHAIVETNALERGEYAIVLLPKDPRVNLASLIQAASHPARVPGGGELAQGVLGLSRLSAPTGILEGLSDTNPRRVSLDRYFWDFSVQ